MMTGQFNDNGKLEFTPTKPKPFNTERLQSAMFVDSPELWRKPPPKKRRTIPTEQDRMEL